jgi:hypothetical protein
MVRATGAATTGPSRGVGVVVVEAIRPKLVPVHKFPSSIRLLHTPKKKKSVQGFITIS